MPELSQPAQVFLLALLFIMGLYSLLVFAWQVKVLQGKAMTNVDGSVDSWHQQKIMYGMAFADVLIACPANIAGIVLVFVFPRWGFYLLALVSFWWVWANVMTTATSLKFEKPALTLNWVITFPFGAFIGLAYIIWSMLYFDIIYFKVP